MSQIRELFIDELEQVNGGGPVEELLEKVMPGSIGGIELSDLWNTTMACGEESGSGC